MSLEIIKQMKIQFFMNITDMIYKILVKDPFTRTKNINKPIYKIKLPESIRIKLGMKENEFIEIFQ